MYTFGTTQRAEFDAGHEALVVKRRDALLFAYRPSVRGTMY